MRFLLLCCTFAALLTSCTTLSNRRDLYNPSEDVGPYDTLPSAHHNGPKSESAPTPSEPLQPAPQ